MTIITISRGSYSKGKEIAELVAKELGYECVSRDVLLEASEEFGIPEVKLVRALHDAPSVLERFTHGRQKYVAYVRQAFLEHMQHDDVVYHGLAGHFFLEGVNHVLKVRIVADMDERVALESHVAKIEPDKARALLEKDDAERHKWSMSLYGIDTADPSLYDILIRIRKVRVPGAVDVITRLARRPQFAATDASRAVLADLLLAARVRTGLVSHWPNVEVEAEGGVVTVHTEGPLRQEPIIVDQISKAVRAMPDVKDVHVDVRPTVF